MWKSYQDSKQNTEYMKRLISKIIYRFTWAYGSMYHPPFTRPFYKTEHAKENDIPNGFSYNANSTNQFTLKSYGGYNAAWSAIFELARNQAWTYLWCRYVLWYYSRGWLPNTIWDNQIKKEETKI